MSKLNSPKRSSSRKRPSAIVRVEHLEKRLTMDADPIVALSLEAVDLDGKVLNKLIVDQPFELRIVAEDLREEPEGIFAAYMDVSFPSDLVEASGDFRPQEPFINMPRGTIGDGVLDEVGSFSDSLVPLGGGRAIIGSYRFVATKPGSVQFTTDPADNLPFHDVLVYGRNVEVGTGQVTYGILQIDSRSLLGTTLTLVAEAEASEPLEAVNDHAKLLSDSAATTIDVLFNDTIPTNSTVSIVSISPAGSNGSASVSADQKAIVYQPGSGMIGTETLTYVVRDQSGKESSAQLQIEIGSRFQNQTVAQDRDGNGSVVPLDALLGINALNQRGPKKLESTDLSFEGVAIFFDVNGDGFHTAIDELLCINMLNQASGEGEALTNQEPESQIAYITDALFETSENRRRR